MFLSSLFALFAAAQSLGATPAIAPVPRDAGALAPLAWFVGDWQCAGQFADGRAIRSRERFDLTPGGHWLRMRHDDVAPGRYHATEWWGRAPAGQGYAVTVFDHDGGLRHYTTSGWLGDALLLHNSARSGYIDRFAFRRLDAASYQVDYSHRDAHGTWRLGDRLRCTRLAASPH